MQGGNASRRGLDVRYVATLKKNCSFYLFICSFYHFRFGPYFLHWIHTLTVFIFAQYCILRVVKFARPKFVHLDKNCQSSFEIMYSSHKNAKI